MKTKSFAERVLGTTSLVVLSAAAMIGAQQPAAAQTGIYGGGSTLSSLALRQIFDCYAGATLANDGQAFSPSFSTATPSPNLLPTSCTLFSTSIEGLFAAVGSGNGQRAYIADDAQQLFRGSPASAPAVVRKPSAKPAFRDTANSAFKSYPYPRLDFAASDAPLASSIASLTTISFSNFIPSTNWQNTLLIGALSSTAASFNPSAVGAPIQVPAMEVPVAIAVNTSNSASGVTWTNQSALSPNNQAGGAIQLSAAQLCAIFSATVTDWHDTSTLIPALDAHGVQQFQHFYDANTNGSLTPVAYTSGRLPIKVVYRVDDAGASFILTNYLKAVCPLLDSTGAYGYQSIFNTTTLPSTSFSNLITRIAAVRGAGGWNNTTATNAWISAQGSGGVASAISTDSSKAGRIGYISADFTQPYAQTVTEEIAGTTISAAAPLSASVQNERQRLLGVYHPGQTGSNGRAQNFVRPTPNNAQLAFSNLTAPSVNSSYDAWNLYAQVYPAGTVVGGVTYDGLSVIGIPLQTQSDYPITGASFLNVYSCYSDTAGTRVPAVKNWLAWYFGGSITGLPNYNPATSNSDNPGYDPNVARVIRNNGFHELDGLWATNILNAYLTSSAAGGLPTAIAAYSTSGTQTDGCAGVTGGAN